MKNSSEETKDDHIRHMLHNCNKFIFYSVGKGTQQNKAIRYLKDGPVSQKDLQEHLGVQPASVSELISKLEVKGLVERSRSETDRRVVMLSLTQAGAKLEKDISQGKDSIDLFSNLSEEEKDQLLDLLRKVYDGFMKHDSQKTDK